MIKVGTKAIETRIEIIRVTNLKGRTRMLTSGKETLWRPKTHANRLIGEVVPCTPPTRNVEGTILMNIVRVLPNAMYVVKNDISPEDVL